MIEAAQAGWRRLTAGDWRIDWRIPAATMAVALLTLVGAQAGASIVAASYTVSPFWPADGIAVGAMLAASGRFRPACLAGALAGILAFDIAIGRDLVSIVLFLLGHAIELVLIDRLVGTRADRPMRLDSLHNLLILLGVTVLAVAMAAVVVALAMAGLGLGSSAQPAATFGDLWQSWFAAHIVGIMVVAPVVLVVIAGTARPLRLGVVDAEGALAMLAIIACAQLGLATSGDSGSVLARVVPLALLFPLLLWSAVRCRPICAALAGLVASWFTAIGIADGRGPFVTDGQVGVDEIAAAQVFMLAVALCALALSALIQDRRRASGALGEALQRNALALAAGEIGTWSYNPFTRIIEADERARDIWGLDRDGPVSDDALASLVHPDDRGARLAHLQAALDPRGSGALVMEYRLLPASGGAERWLVVRGKAEFVDGRAQTLFGTVRDITARHHAEDVLARDRQAMERLVTERTGQLQSILDSAVSAIVTIDAQGIIQSVNAATMTLFGFRKDQLIGRNVSMLMPPPDADRHDSYIAAFLRTGQKRIIGTGREVIARRKDGSTFPIHLAVSEFQARGARHFTGIITDLTDHKAAQDALRETERRLALAQKMEAIGQLTGGIAHDFNNLLTVVAGNLELLDMQLEDDGARDLLRRAEEAARKGARLTERLSTFASRRALQPVVLDLNETTIAMTELMRRTLGDNVSVGTDLAPGLWRTRVDPGEIENAILNLAINARDAMPDGGRIVIETQNITLHGADVAGAGDARPGAFVRLSVIDSGTGMTPEVAARAFEPFFTTKEAGKGTGLGLSTIYGFVRQSGGHMRIDSTPGKGTTVSLMLPRDGSGDDPASRQQAQITSIPTAGETVLVVEDNDEVRALAVRHLESLGYRTIVAADGMAAIAVLEGAALEGGSKVDVVFSDVVMPGGVSGFELARRIRQLRSAPPVLLTSAFAPQEPIDAISPAAETEVDSTTPPLLRKPYSRAELARAIGQVLRDHEAR